jgi:hypothetical protein
MNTTAIESATKNPTRDHQDPPAAGRSRIGSDVTMRPLRVRHALLVFATPRSLFARIADSSAYGSALFTLLALVMLIGYAQVQTGLIDREVDLKTEIKLEQLEKTQGHLIDRVEFRDRMESIQKEGMFLKVMTRLGVIVIAPAYLLASFLLIASLLYAVVALTGRKPEYHTLMAICVFAGFTELAAYALRLSMMLYYRTVDVDTSLGALATSDGLKFLAAIYPFCLWFWILVAIGLIVTQQLSRRMAIMACASFAVVAMGIRAAMVYAGS